MRSRVNQTIKEIRRMMNPVVASQFVTFLVAAACFYASNIIVFASPSISLYILPIHPVAVLFLKPQLKVTLFGAYLIINGNFWIPLIVNPSMPYVFFAVGSAAFALALALDIHPDTAPNWYGILRARYGIDEIRKALKIITSNTRFKALLATLQTSTLILTVTSFYHYAVNYLINGGLQWEIVVGTTIINPAVLIIFVTLFILVAKAVTYKKLKSTLPQLIAPNS